jgi:hypothetical protein
VTIQWQGGKPDIKAELSRYVKDELYKVAVDVYNGVVARTPARSGELRASWNLSADAPNFATVGDANTSPREVDVPLPSPGPPTRPRTRSGVYYVTNGKAYAGVVEDGGPNNEAHHMMDRTLDSLDL